jgi:GTA TIM-barrel-like domain/Putative phage tail protein
MATILLSAAGAAFGAGFGGTVLGLSGAVIGQAIGATLGRALDQRLLGAGSDAVDVGRVERFRLTGASEGAAIGQVWGRMRVAGQVIWATEFAESSETRGGKGASRPKVTEYSYTVSLAIGLCEGVITRVGRVWADGQEVEAGTLNMRVYRGTESQLPDAKIAAVEGADKAPAYRGTAYVVIEDLDLGAYGNRVPQFNFEVMRRAQGASAGMLTDVSTAVQGVALIPGTGEYALATTAVHYAEALGANRSANVNSASGQTDFATSLGQLREELPNCDAVSMVVSWFGDDLRCGSCLVQPKVEQVASDGVGMPWRAGGITRAQAAVVAQDGGRPVYGGTPADAAVVEGIRALVAAGKQVMFYPFILMDQMAGNTLPDPYGGAAAQAALPWRGRVTTALAPGVAGTSDGTAGAEAEVAAFFGTAQPGDFAVADGVVNYTGPAEWRYRRFILHYAHLCALAGGVEAFCIGSEMVGLTRIRGGGDSFPAVAALRVLAGDVRAILGPGVKISYAADWSEYSGYQRDGNRYFHLDPLWADANVDFVGIDNYMPISDWRDGEDHADAGWGSIYNLDYLKANVAGGEGFDWYYNGPEGEAAQRRLPITDGAYGEPWVYRYKDLKSWWSLAHHERIGGVRSGVPTAWVPGSKPIRFTEYGCAALDKATNEPNKFLDPKSSESSLPKYSNGRRDDLIQQQYLRAMNMFWADVANNPVAVSYAGRMLDMGRSYVWAWDSRPFPAFPGNQALWSDGGNYRRGHWLNGRAMAQSLAGVVLEICERSGAAVPDVSGLHGLVKGYATADLSSARAALQPLMLVHGFDAIERDGVLSFRMRDGRVTGVIAADGLAETEEFAGTIEAARTPDAEVAGQVRLTFLEAEGSYELRQADASLPDAEARGVAQTDVALLMTGAEARVVAERWLAEARVARDGARFALPPSALAFGPGDVLELDAQRYRVDRVERGDHQIIDAVRIEAGVYRPSDAAEERVVLRGFAAPVPVYPLFLDLPLLTGDEVPHAPHIAVTARPWPGAVGVWLSDSDDGYVLNKTLPSPSVVGVTETAMPAAQPGVWDRGPALRVRLAGRGSLATATESAVFSGANALAIGDGSADRWEVLQFRDAVLVGPSTYELSHRLRGQAGSDGVMPSSWPAGSTVVLLNRNVRQLDLASSARGVEKHVRIGALTRGPSDPAAVLKVAAFEGVGLRPYPVCHMARGLNGDGSVNLSWVRRTRIDGDGWQLAEVPLGEEVHEYALRVRVGGTVVREVRVSQPEWAYSLADQTADGALGAHQIEVAQMSARFGPGPYRTLAVQ